MRWRVGEGLAVGSAAVLLSLITYASPVEERVWWRWSQFDAIVLGVVLLVVVVTFLVLRTPAAGPIDGGNRPTGRRTASYCRDLGWALWGLGYLIGSALTFDTRGRLLRLDFFNSVVPGASFLELAGVALFLTGVVLSLWSSGKRTPALLLGLPLLLLIAGEGWARFNAMYHPRVTPLESTMLDRWRRLHVQTNPDGFRDSTHAVAKREGWMRVAVVGDGAAEGIGLEEVGDRISEQLAYRLSGATGESWEPLNFGREGTDTKDQVAALAEVRRYSPDLVVLLYSFDDIEYFAPVRRREVLARPGLTWQERLHPILLPYQNSVLFQEAFLEFRTRYPSVVGAGMLPEDPYQDSTLVAAHFAELEAFAEGTEGAGIMTLIVPFDVEAASDPGRMSRYRAFEAAATAAQLPVWGVDTVLEGRSAGQLVVDTLTRFPNAAAHRAIAEAIVPRVHYLRSPQPVAVDTVPAGRATQ